jgi:sugar fermentation stimulation protein A
VQQGHRAVMVYLVQRNDAKSFQLAPDLDPTYAESFTVATAAGVEAIALKCRLSPLEIVVEKELPIKRGGKR